MGAEPENAEAIEATIQHIGKVAADWTDDEFAAKIVGLLILDKGLINAWDRTIRLMLRISRVRDTVIRDRQP